MSESGLRVAMGELLAELEREHARAVATLEAETSGLWDRFTNWAGGVDEGPIGAWKGALRMSGENIARLRTERHGAVLRGEESFTAWKSAAENERKRVSYVLSELGRTLNFSSRFWDEVVIESGEQLGQGVASVAEGVRASIPWLSAAVVAAVVGYVVYTFRR